jgi:AbrB family looped-hinge helix DNA binding protein
MRTKVNAKGRIVIPATLRQKYGIRKGTRIVIIDNGNLIILKPITEQYLKKLQGSLKGTGALKVLLDERRNKSE